jgi:hypothetical protein
MEFFFKPKNIAVVGALAKLFSLSRRYRFRNMIDERGHIAAPALDVATIDDAIIIASGRQLLGIGQCRHIELAVAVVASSAGRKYRYPARNRAPCRWRSVYPAAAECRRIIIAKKSKQSKWIAEILPWNGSFFG